MVHMWGWRGGFDQPPENVRLEWPLLRRVFAYFVPYWPLSLVVLACIAVTSALGLVPALVTKTLIDYLTGRGGQFSFIGLLIGILVASSLISGLVGVLQSYVSTRISQSIMYDLRNQLFDRVIRQSVAFFTRTRTGDVMSRLSNDVNGVQSVVSDTIFSLVSNVVILASTLVLMVTLSWKMTIVALLVLPAFVLPTLRVGKATFSARKQTQGKLAEMTAFMQEVLGISGILLVKAFVTQSREDARFERLNHELRGLNIRQAMIGRWFFMLMGVLGTAGPAVLWLFGGYLVITGGASLGTVVTFATLLLPRLYGPQIGSVRVDGHDIRGLPLESLGKQIGMVFQDTFLFHASVRENLLYARPDATEQEMVAAARAAHIHEFVESLPLGYDTIVGERGHRLSGGEKQRVAIARVVLKDPRILILDEATSNLDSESEHLIQVALAGLLAGRTSLVIAHRLSTILAADTILVLDRGRLVEQGRHLDLLGRGGIYARLYQQQFLPEAVEAARSIA